MCDGNNDKAIGGFILNEVYNIEQLINYIKPEAEVQNYFDSIMNSVRSIKSITYQMSKYR